MTDATIEQADRTGRELRWLADNYEQAQQMRIETGERIRAVVQGRDETFVPVGEFAEPNGDEDADRAWLAPELGPLTADELLEAIARNRTRGPVPMLGRAYFRYRLEEEETREDMDDAFQAHPTHEWLSQVTGVGATLACKILSRVDAEKAPYDSSMWKYCGLSTVPGEKYKCPECEVVKGFPAGYNVSGEHKEGGAGSKCSGTLEKVAGPDDGIRVAQPSPRKGEPASYDQYAKKVMYQIATSILQQHGASKSRGGDGTPYGRLYETWREEAEVERPNWPDGRKHYRALRKLEKLFLSHLWQVWREELGLDTPDPWIFAHGGHDASQRIDPWEMV